MTIMCLSHRPETLRAKAVGSILIVWHDANASGVYDPQTEQVWTGALNEEIRAIGSVGRFNAATGKIDWSGYGSGTPQATIDPRIAEIKAALQAIIAKL